MKTIFASLGIILFASTNVSAESFAYPQTQTKPILMIDAPDWLKENKGDDGYLSISAQIDQGKYSCVKLGKDGLLNDETMQIVISLVSDGFRTQFDKQEIPIAIFDGRSTPGGCAVLNTQPLEVVSFARLDQSTAANPGALSLILKTKSTTDTKMNLVGGAQLVLGTVAVFATGGTAATVVGLSSTLAKPALVAAQDRANTSLSNVSPGESAIPLNWGSIRGGIQSYVVPVYLGQTLNYSEQPATAIERLTDTPPKNRKKLFDVVLTFRYTKSLFDKTLTGKDDLPQNDKIARQVVLNTGRPGTLNFYQLLSKDSPAFLQNISTAKGNDLTASCNFAWNTLEQAGLNMIDRAVVMKSVIDEAKKNQNWYTADNLYYCYKELPDMRAITIKIYPLDQGPPPKLSDVAFGKHDGQEYEAWLSNTAPILSLLQNAMLSQDARYEELLKISGNQEIDVEFSGGAHSAFSSVQLNPENPKSKNPKVWRLSSKSIVAAGCFAYETEAFKPKNSIGYTLIKDDQGNFWGMYVKLKPNELKEIEKVQIFELSQDWNAFFKQYQYGATGCKNILAALS